MTDTRQAPHRDEELGAALRELQTPEHAPGFYWELENRAAPKRPRRPSRLRWGVGAGIAAAAAAAALAVGLPRTGGPEPASAADVKARVQQSLREVRMLSGLLVSDGAGPRDETRQRFFLTSDGSFRLEGPGENEVIAYDAGAGLVRSVQRSASLGGGPLFAAERRGVAPGLPDPGPPDTVLLGELGAFVRAVLAAEDPRLSEVVYEGRPAWRLDVDAVPNAIVPEFSGDRLEVTVDRETGIPVRVVERKQGAFLRELRVEGLAVDTVLPPRWLHVPVRGEVMRSDDGFERVRLEAVAGIVGYAPLVPTWVPDGYELAEVAVARRSGPTGTEGGNPPSRMVVSLAFRRGFDRFLVTTRLAAGGPWSDPLATGEGFRDEPEPVALRGGALRGASAELLIVPRGVPHVWALTDELVVTVGGDLTRSELVRVAESLARYGR